MKLVLFFACVLFGFQQCLSARILAVFPTGARSTVLVLQELTKELANRGHDVTFVSFFPLEKPVKNHRDVKMDVDHDLTTLITYNLKNSANKITFLKSFPYFLNLQSNVANSTINHPTFKKIMAEESFDLVLIGFHLNTFLIGLGDHFKCPVIVMGTAGKITMLDYLIGNPLDISAVPHLMKPFKGKMNFVQRLQTFLVYTVDFFINTYVDYVHEGFYSYNFPPDKYISFKEAKRNVSLVLSNDHFTFGGPRPLIPGMIEIGGIQSKKEPKPLPPNLKSWMEGAKDGVILFSIGSNAKSSFMPVEKIEVLMNSFAKLKQRVIFKWEADTLPNKPKNVLAVSWMPQDDILAHPNLTLFVTHGGLGGIAEAKYHAVPIVAMPLFGDQMSNVEKAVKEGWAVKVDYKDLNEQDFTAAIKEILGNNKYKNQVKYLSELYKDRPMPALDTAVFWTEYVIRHKGAPHMHYFGGDLNFIQKNSLDVIGFFLLAFYIIIKVIKKSVKFVFSKIFSGKKTDKNLKKKKA